MAIRVSGGGGGGYPGVAANGDTPAGITVDGRVSAEAIRGLALGDVAAPAVDAESLTPSQDAISASAQYNSTHAITAVHAADNARCATFDADGTGSTAVSCSATGTGGIALSATGKMLGTAGIGLWSHAAPSSQPLLATGASHTVDDVIGLLQSYGLCKQS